MPSCFVIQPFDRGTFDKRYADVFEPAIREAGLEPYRVDRDPAASIPIQEIEDGIRSAEICFAEITTDNPNVWFELGYAIAVEKDVVLVCSSQRASHFPFDIQHRNVITYKTESASDFSELRRAIVARIEALLKKEKRIRELSRVLKPTEGLLEHEIVTLITVAKGAVVPGATVPAWSVRHDCVRTGYTEIAVTLALHSLTRLQYLELDQDFDDRGDPYPAYRATDAGINWLEENQDRLVLRKKKPKESNDDIPF